MDVLMDRAKNFYNKEGVHYGQTFTPRPTDVFIDTYGKAGTTWVQQICHSLRSNGDTDFEDITMVCPWDVFALDCNQDLDADQAFSPRIFKSHEPWPRIAKANPPCKYIHIVRDPVDVFVSSHQFVPGSLGLTPEDIPMDQFCDTIFANSQNSGNIAQFYMEWFKAWKMQKDDNILWLFFEDLKKDLSGAIRKIAKLMDIELTPELMKIVLHDASYETMKKNKSKFKDVFMFNQIKDRLGLSHLNEPTVAKVREGKVGASKELPQNIVDKINKMWKETITPELGFETYSDMMKYIHKSESI